MKNKRQVREKILSEAARLFYLQGFENTTIDDIQKSAGIARGSIYYHFPSKQEILETIVDKMAEEVLKALKPVVEGEASFLSKLNAFFTTSINIKMEKFKAEMLFYLDFLKNRRNYLFHFKIIEKYKHVVSDMLRRILEDGVQEGKLQISSPGIYAKLLTEILLSLSEELTEIILKAQNKTDALREIESVVKVHNESICKILGINEEYTGLSIVLEKSGEILELYLKKKGVK